MIYELLTGKPPFYSGSIERQIESITPPSMVERRRELKVEGSGPIPETWERVVAACLEKESGKRPRSVREVWEGLSGVQVVEAVSGKRAKKGPGAGAGRKGLAAVGAGVLVWGGGGVGGGGAGGGAKGVGWLSRWRLQKSRCQRWWRRGR
jgi:hypothetical protein